MLIFDGDDTLWVVEPLYDEARALVRAYVELNGLDGARWEGLAMRIDVANVRLLGLAATRFPTSCVQAYERLAALTFMSQRPDEGRVKAEIRRLAQTVFQRKAPLVEGVEKVLSSLSHSFPLALLTQGDAGVQHQRIAESGLHQYFTHVEIVERKTLASFQSVLVAVGAPAGQSWSIGNSLPSDIVPALQCGMGTIWVDAHVWEYERRASPAVEGRVIRARCLEDVPDILTNPAILASVGP